MPLRVRAMAQSLTYPLSKHDGFHSVSRTMYRDAHQSHSVLERQRQADP